MGRREHLGDPGLATPRDRGADRSGSRASSRPRWRTPRRARSCSRRVRASSRPATRSAGASSATSTRRAAASRLPLALAQARAGAAQERRPRRGRDPERSERRACPGSRGAPRARARNPPRSPHRPRSRPGVESLADRTPLPIMFDALPDDWLPPPIEAAAFYVVSEALANVTKYAEASSTCESPRRTATRSSRWPTTVWAAPT